MTDKFKKKSVFTNFIWRFAERCGAQGVTFIVSIVLARILDPEVYGTVALITVFTSILQAFIDGGFGNALIQKKESDDLDFSTVFYFNVFMCICLYILMYFFSPVIARFYTNEELTPVIRVLSLTIVISGIKNVQQAYVSKNMLFKKFFYSTLFGTIGAAVIGIWMAFKGMGVWALVVQQLFNAALDTTILWITVDWRPKRQFSFERLRGLFGYGWKLLVSSLIDKTYFEIRQLIIGKVYSQSDLAFFNKGQQFPNLIVTNVNTSIDSVLLPAMSNEQDDKERVKLMTSRAIKTSTFIMAPLMIGLATVAPQLVKILLTEKWLPCVPFLRIFCITFLFYPIHTANLNAIKALGRSDIFLKLEILKKIVGFIALAATMFISVEAMAYSLLVTTVLNQIINSWPNKRLLDYSYLNQIKDILPNIALALLMGISIYFVPLTNFSDWVILLLQVLIGAIFYITVAKVLKNESLIYILSIIKSYMKKKKEKK